jgi:hypothetical protein
MCLVVLKEKHRYAKMQIAKACTRISYTAGYLHRVKGFFFTCISLNNDVEGCLKLQTFCDTFVYILCVCVRMYDETFVRRCSF